MAAHGFFTMTFRDYDGELSSTRIHVPVMTLANFAAQETLRNDFASALAGLCLGVTAAKQYGTQQLITRALPTGGTAKNAQIERKWLVSFHDTITFARYNIQVPTADSDLLDANDRAHARIGDAGYVDDFITKFNAYALSDAGNAVVVDEIALIGRPV
jgi:hypothetical protein